MEKSEWKHPLLPELREYAKKRMGGLTDEQVDNLTEEQWNILKSAWLRHKYLMVAEVINVQDVCSAQHKVGQRYVFNASGFLLPEECTVTNLCLWATHNMLSYCYVVYELLAQGLDPTPIGYNGMQCQDVGIAGGGIGRVNFRIHCEENPNFKDEKPPWAIDIRS